MKIPRKLAFKTVDILVDIIRRISVKINYREIIDAHDRGYIWDYVNRCRRYIQKADCVFEFAGEIIYATNFNANVKTGAFSLHKDRWEADYYFDIMDENTLPEEKFDCILATNFLNYVNDVHVAMKNMKKMLNDDGVLILTVHGPAIRKSEGYAYYTRYGIEEICKQHFDKVFNVREYGDLNHAVYALTGMGRIKEEVIQYLDNIMLVTGICCQK